MSLFNYSSSLDRNFNPFPEGSSAITSEINGSFPGGVPFMTPNVQNPSGFNQGYMQATNGQVKITLNTRTTDQKYLNSAQLAFVDSEDVDSNRRNHRLLSLQAVNKLIVEGSTPGYDSIQDRFYENMGKLDSKKEIMARFKCIGVVVNTDVDNSNRNFYSNVPTSRLARSFTIVTWGDAFVHDYWSHNENVLYHYDDCFLVLKKVKLKESDGFQTNLTVSAADTHEGFQDSRNKPLRVDFNRYYWQFVPFSCRQGCLPFKQLENDYEETITGGVGNKTKVKRHELGTYIRIGRVHEYADIEKKSLYESRNEFSVSRDVVHMHNNGKARPLQFYLRMDDESKLI